MDILWVCVRVYVLQVLVVARGGNSGQSVQGHVPLTVT